MCFKENCQGSTHTRRCQDDDAHQILLYSLVGKVEEGLAAVTVEKDIDSHGSLSTGLLGSAGDARCGGELIRRCADLVTESEATVCRNC